MAADFIPIIRNDSQAIFFQDLVSLPQQVRALVDKLESVQQRGFRMFEGSDFTVFETKFGIPTGQGQTAFDLVNGTLQAMTGQAQNANAVELMNRVG